MSLFRFQWLRNLIRRHTTPISEEEAYSWNKRLSFLYVFLAWNGFGFVVWNIYNGNADWARKFKSPEELALTPAQQWSQTLGIKNAKVMRISGLNVTKYDIHNKFDDDDDEADTDKIKEAEE